MLRLHVYERNAAISNEEAFLRRTVHNLSVDQYRGDRPDLHRKVPLDTVNFDTEWISVNSNLEQIVDTRQRLDRVGALLEAASTRTREIYMAHRAGYTYAEITDHMNISVITIKRHIARALRIVTEYQAKERGEGHANPHGGATLAGGGQTLRICGGRGGGSRPLKVQIGMGRRRDPLAGREAGGDYQWFSRRT
jgi:DNA-directed RNA polymerase specialized sigma24 family protein